MRILIVSDPRRKDFYDYLVQGLGIEHDLFLLWDYRPGDSGVHQVEGVKLLFWKDYASPEKLIHSVKPDRIVFLEIIDYWQIPLIITCHALKIPSFFLEHGVGNSVDMVMARFNEIAPLGKRIAYYFKKLFFTLPRIIRNRIFFMSAAKFLSQEERAIYFKLFILYKKYTPIHALSQLKFRKRTPHFALLFNRNNVAPFLLYNEIEEENVILEGVPFFDKYYWLKSPEKEHVVFIEHPYLEFQILKWGDAFHEKLARTLEKFAIQNNTRIIVKLHPRSNIENWNRYKLDKLVEIRQAEDITSELLSAKLILGYSSTLLNVMIACKKNVVFLGWHPEPQVWGDDFSKTGLCHVSFDMSELFTDFQQWVNNNRAVTNEQAYHDFLMEYNYPFDGKATVRVIQSILGHEVH